MSSLCFRHGVHILLRGDTVRVDVLFPAADQERAVASTPEEELGERRAFCQRSVELPWMALYAFTCCFTSCCSELTNLRNENCLHVTVTSRVHS